MRITTCYNSLPPLKSGYVSSYQIFSVLLLKLPGLLFYWRASSNFSSPCSQINIAFFTPVVFFYLNCQVFFSTGGQAVTSHPPAVKLTLPSLHQSFYTIGYLEGNHFSLMFCLGSFDNSTYIWTLKAEVIWALSSINIADNEITNNIWNVHSFSLTCAIRCLNTNLCCQHSFYAAIHHPQCRKLTSVLIFINKLYLLKYTCTASMSKNYPHIIGRFKLLSNC